MKITDVIRNVLDIIDQAESDESPSEPVIIDSPDNTEEFYNDEIARFKQIAQLLTNPDGANCANSPDEKYADVSSVTILAGGGVNGPKHPHDIRLKDPSQHPMQQGF